MYVGEKVHLMLIMNTFQSIFDNEVYIPNVFTCTKVSLYVYFEVSFIYLSELLVLNFIDKDCG